MRGGTGDSIRYRVRQLLSKLVFKHVPLVSSGASIGSVISASQLPVYVITSVADNKTSSFAGGAL